MRVAFSDLSNALIKVTMEEQNLVTQIRAIFGNEALCTELIYSFAEAKMRCFEIDSNHEGSGCAGLCLMELDDRLEPAQVAMLLLFRLEVFDAVPDYIDFLTSGPKQGDWLDEASRPLRTIAISTPYGTKTVRERIIDHVDGLRHEFAKSHLPPNVRKKFLNKRFSVRECGHPFPENHFDYSLLDGPFSEAYTLWDEWNDQGFLFKSPDYWGLFKWVTSA